MSQIENAQRASVYWRRRVHLSVYGPQRTRGSSACELKKLFVWSIREGEGERGGEDKDEWAEKSDREEDDVRPIRLAREEGVTYRLSDIPGMFLRKFSHPSVTSLSTI